LKKFLYLALALMLPGLVFVFLKYAGKNEFAIPVFHEEGVNAPSDCAIIYPKPYLVPDSIWQVTGLNREANVLLFPSKGLDRDRLQSVIEGEFGEDVVGLKQAVLLTGDSVTWQWWKKCIFLVNTPAQAVLLDRAKRIRGYYDLRNRDEEDRLRVELKILLKKY
jgi:hypothetical protein